MNIKWPIFFVAVVFVGWAAVILASGSGYNLTGVDWSFERTGQLGDSFGILGAGMAALAAIFTYETLRESRLENARLREREVQRDRDDRKRDVETTFFNMLAVRSSILNAIGYASLNGTTQGSDAIESMINFVHRQVNGQNVDAREAYAVVYSANKNDLGHYFRFTYHIIKYVDERLNDFVDSYSYMRMLRGQLSNAEIILIALNCTYGAGAGPFHGYVERFALLHNLSEGDIDKWRLREHFAARAFGIA
jgi:hypothetical protein